MRRVSIRDERGSAPVEFVLVGVLVIALVLGVMQLALALHVRNTLQDAAAEGARWASLIDSSAEQGRSRTAELIAIAVGENYASSIDVHPTTWLGRDAVEVSVRATLPLVGLFGPADALVVSARSTQEILK